jgi:uncharacterized membrane protein YbhN (UPF0104 family)
VNRVEVLLEFAKIENEEARRYEAQRERILGVMLIVTGAALAAIFAQPEVTALDIALAAAAFLLNVTISITSLSFYLAFKRRYERYRSLRKEIGREIGEPSVEEIIRTADAIDASKNRYPWLRSFRLHSVWSVFSWTMSACTLAILLLLSVQHFTSVATTATEQAPALPND